MNICILIFLIPYTLQKCLLGRINELRFYSPLYNTNFLDQLWNMNTCIVIYNFKSKSLFCRTPISYSCMKYTTLSYFLKTETFWTKSVSEGKRHLSFQLFRPMHFFAWVYINLNCDSLYFKKKKMQNTEHFLLDCTMYRYDLFSPFNLLFSFFSYHVNI